MRLPRPNTRFLAGLGGMGLTILGCLVACQNASRSTPAPARSRAVSEASGAALRTNRPLQAKVSPRTLLTVASSAYGAHVFPRVNETVVVTPTQLFRVRGEAEVERHEVHVGPHVVLLDDSIVFWRDGALRSLSLVGMKEATLLPLEQEPRHLVASSPRIAWLKRDLSGLHAIETLSLGTSQGLYSSRHELSAPVLHEENVYFIESSGNRWRIGRAPLNGTPVGFGPDHTTRRPSLLAVGPDGIYFYDGPERSVVRSTFNLSHEEAVSRGVICSPLAVSSRVVCASVGGVFDIPRPGADPRTIGLETGGPIAGFAATDDTVYWIADGGENEMTVRSMALPPI